MPGPECYKKGLDWVEECELASKSKPVKANYVLISKSTQQVNESHRGAEGRSKCPVKKLRGVDKAKIQRIWGCNRPANWSKVILALQSTLKKPLFYATSVNILQKPAIGYLGMQ